MGESHEPLVEVNDELLVQLLLPAVQQVEVGDELGKDMTRVRVNPHDIGVLLALDMVLVERVGPCTGMAAHNTSLQRNHPLVKVLVSY